MARPRALGDEPPGPAAAEAAAHRVQIPPTAQMQLSAGLNWIGVASRGRLSAGLIDAVMRHQRAARTEPAILIAAAIQYLISGSDREKDWLNRYWHIADQISARERARYLNVDKQELM